MKRIIIILLLLSNIGFAQNLKWQTHLNRTDTSGFFKIFLIPEITSKLNYNFADIRIFNQKNKEIPYLKSLDKTIKSTDKYHAYKIIENKHKLRKAYTRLLIHNPDKKDITNIVLFVENNDYEIVLKLSGSNDQKSWYIIKDNFSVLPVLSNKETTEVRILDFPLSNYEFYEILVYDYNHKAIKIKKAIYYDIKSENIKYQELKAPYISQDDTIQKEKSIVKLTFKEPQYIDKLVFDVENNGGFYLRNVTLTKEFTQNEKTIKTEFYDEAPLNFQLSSTSDNTVYLPSYKAQILKIVIKNKNNEPLKIKSVKAYQLKTFLTVYLKEKQKYTLKFGNPQLETPLYDLKYFADSIPDTIPEINVGKLINLQKTKTEEERKWYVSPTYLWIIVGAIAAFLLYMSYKMFGELIRSFDEPESDPENKDA